MKREAVRPQELCKDVIVIDGMSGSGKSLLAPIVSSLQGNELWISNYLYDYLCALYRLRLISRSAAASLVRTHVDLDLYNLRIGRCVNFRPTDLSSPFRNLLEERYRSRSEDPKEGDAVVREINRVRPRLVLMTHYIFGAIDLLFASLKTRLKLVILPVRHPLWLVEGWLSGSWDKRIGRDPREFQQTVRVGRAVVPWFAAARVSEYLSLTPMEKSIWMTESISKTERSTYRTMTASQKKRTMIIPFETFVRNPDVFIAKIAKKINARPSGITAGIKHRMRVPRDFGAADLAAQRKKVSPLLAKHRVRERWRDALDRLSRDYERTFLTQEVCL